VALAAMFCGFNALGAHVTSFGIKFFIQGLAFPESYNPGFIQSLLINAPFNYYAIYRLWKANLISTKQVVFIQFLSGVPGHFVVLMPGVFIGMNDVISHWQNHLINLVMPLLVTLVFPHFFTPTAEAKALGQKKKEE